MKNRKRKPATMSSLMKLAAALSSILMVLVLFLPIWKIELAAPQYPEGLVLKIHANKLAGNVDVVNGLNHYIGMRPLHAEDFVEFTVLPYIIGGFATLCLLTLVLNRRKIFDALVALFLVVAFVSMADFYRWEYNYGHELNPDAPIQVPGMAYQPPLIGYKQLLNFGAFSIPDTGGWLFVASGVLLAGTWALEWMKKRKRVPAHAGATMVAACMLLITSCSTAPCDINYGKDACSFCKMNIMDPRFSAQCITTKGKSYLFDDAHCLLSFMKNGGVWRNELSGVYFSEFNSHRWLRSDSAFLVQSDSLRSPMGGNIIALGTSGEQAEAAQKFNGKKLSWQDINPFEKK